MLGDVVISTGMVQYDFGRQYPGGFRRKEGIEDSLGRANPEIRSFLSMLATRQNRQRFNRELEQLVTSSDFQDNFDAATYLGVDHDRLYEASYVHQHRSNMTCERCLVDVGTCSRDCKELGCEDDGLDRDRLAYEEKKLNEGQRRVAHVHLGRFCSANLVMKSGQDRDRLSATDEVTAFEMEGAGIWDQYPTVVIKAACDYADSHKSKDWQDHATAMAAATLKVFLQEWIVSGLPPGQDELYEPVWHVPFSPIPGLIGRRNELRRLERKLFDPHSRRVVSLVGLGGMGKSRLALELAYNVKLTQPQHSVFWVQASDQLTLEHDMLEIGRKLRIPGIDDRQADIKALVRQYLSLPSMNKWLLFLDNADDEALWGRRSNLQRRESSLIDHLPVTMMHGSILVTTRTRRVATFLAEKEVVSLSTMTDEEAAKLLASKLEDHDIATDQFSLSVLADKLANLPLAIIQAAAYIDMTQTTIHTYLDLLDQPEVEVVRLLSKDFGDASRYPNAINPVVTTWMISFDHIEKHHTLAADFLSTMTCLHDRGIPSSLLPEADSKVNSVDALAILEGYSIATKQSGMTSRADGYEFYDVHRLVQLAARSWLRDRETLFEWTKACIIRLLRLLPSAYHERKHSWTMYLSHAQRLCGADVQGVCAERYDLLARMGLYYLADGKYSEAVSAKTAVVRWREHTLGVSDLMTLTAYNHLGLALHSQGSSSAAESYPKSAVDGLVAALGNSHVGTMSSMKNLAGAPAGQGKYQEAETMYREILQLQQTTLYGSHRSTLGTMNSLALAVNIRGRHEEAEAILDEILPLMKTTLCKDHPLTLTSMNNRALAFSSQSKYEEAEQTHREALQLQREVLGKSHPETLTTMSNLAFDLARQGKYQEAETILRTALQEQETLLGKSHPATLVSYNTLAVTLSAQGKYTEAETAHRETLQLQENVLGKCPFITLTNLTNLAWNLRAQNRTEEAIALIQSCAERSSDVLGPEHPATQAAAARLTEWLSSTAHLVDQQPETDENRWQIPGSSPD